jgi:hypothetical protein
MARPDNDGWLDLLAVNSDQPECRSGHGAQRIFLTGPAKPLLPVAGNEDVTERAGRVFELVEASRGAAFGDIDNDRDRRRDRQRNACDRQVGNRHHHVRLRLVRKRTRWNWRR